LLKNHPKNSFFGQNGDRTRRGCESEGARDDQGSYLIRAKIQFHQIEATKQPPEQFNESVEQLPFGLRDGCRDKRSLRGSCCCAYVGWPILARFGSVRSTLL
jgi:hypothetical protein